MSIEREELLNDMVVFLGLVNKYIPEEFDMHGGPAMLKKAMDELAELKKEE